MSRPAKFSFASTLTSVLGATNVHANFDAEIKVGSEIEFEVKFLLTQSWVHILPLSSIIT